jgi:2-methylcitrate dehydratase
VPNRCIHLTRKENQARGIGQYAIDFIAGRLGEPDPAVSAKVEQFHLDGIACAVAALGCCMNAPVALRKEALLCRVRTGEPSATCLGSLVRVKPEKAVLANCSAVRELDANGTNFGFNPTRGDAQGEFGHNDFYPVVLAAAQQVPVSGRKVLRAMICLDEIRARLAEVFALRRYKIDHVMHGAIASAAVYGALLGATPDQIESAIGLTVAHYVPFRAIRHGHQLSDSKGASAAITTEMAVQSVHRALRGFVGPADIFRNPQAIFCLFEPSPAGESPFDLHLATSGDDFAVMGMHFKLGMYEHQSAGAIQALIDLLTANPSLLDDISHIQRVRVALYEPALSIIGDPAKRDPHNRQSADHSMVYILGRLLRRAFGLTSIGWRELMLLPSDYSDEALFDPLTRQLMSKIELIHGGPEFDARYPDGIPTQLEIEHSVLGTRSSSLVMYPLGHARNTSPALQRALSDKFDALARLAVTQTEQLKERLTNLDRRTPQEMQQLYDFRLDHAWIA